MLFEPVGDSASRQVIGTQFHSYLVSGEYLDEMHPHLPGYVSEYLMPVLYLNTKHGVGERLQDRTLYFYGIFFRHILTFIAFCLPANHSYENAYFFEMIHGPLGNTATVCSK